MLLLRIWRERQSAQASRFRCFFYLFYQIMKKKEVWKHWIPLLYVAGVGTCMLSGIGIVTAPVLLAVYGVLDFCYYRNWRKDACHLAGSGSVCDLFRILPDVGVKEWAMYWLCGGICKIYRRTCRSRPSAAVCGGAGLLLLPGEGGAAQIVLAVGAGGNFLFQPGVLQICGNPLLKRGVLAAAVDASVDVRDRLCGGKDGVPAWKAGTAHCRGGGGMCLYLRDREAGFIGGDLRGAVECVRTAAGGLVEIADLVQSRLVDWQETLIVPNELFMQCQTIFRSRMSAVRKKCGGLYLQHRGGRTAGLRGNEQRASGCGACHGDCEK